MSAVAQQLVSIAIESIAIESDQCSSQLHSTDVSLCHVERDSTTVSLLATERTQTKTTKR